jgi:bifunctional oligoribonuclease and PAP phosphatase NrnA
MAFYPDKASDWRNIASLLVSSHRVFITTHVNPDGDAIGSEMALARFLTAGGKPVRIINHSKTPDIYAFLDPNGMIETFETKGGSVFRDGPGPDDLVFFLDMGNLNRAGDTGALLLENGAQSVMIDHHVPEPVNVSIAVTVSTSDSTGSLVFDLMTTIDPARIDHDIAEAVLTAIVTDTGYFTYSNTTPVTLRIAASLYEYGASARDLRKRLERAHPLTRQRLMGLCLAETALASDGRIAWSYISSAMFARTGSSREHTDGIINEIRVIEGISVALILIQESPDIWKASFRSMSGVPVNEIAVMLGGGGHEKAAGATLHGTFEEVSKLVLTTVTEVLDSKEDLRG